jgi:protein CWC15
MTTAHRPTWNTAKGGSEQGGNVLINPSRAYSSKDMPSHTSLKERVSG